MINFLCQTLFVPKKYKSNHLGRIMKLSTFLLLSCAFTGIAGNVSSQNARVTLNENNVAVSKILNSIESQTDYLFIYNKNNVNVSRTASVKAKEKTVDKVLSELFNGTNITYEMEGKHIVLSMKKNTSEINSTAQSQQTGKTVTGVIKDKSGLEVIGANIVEKGTTNGTITDVNGQFSLTVQPGATLQISYIGYNTKEVKIGNESTFNIILEEDSQALDEIVVVGFGTQKKANLTGAVGQVQMDKVLGDRPVTNLGSALQGAIPGFTASSSAVPGGGNNWNIRGLESINGGSPLVLVDNVVFNDLYLLNPADIESVSVLKDASSAAIYGARASFGVILITTKKAKKNETLTINYNNNFAVSNVANILEPASPMDFIQTLKDGGYTSIWSGQNLDVYMDLLSKYNNNPSAYPKGWTDVNGTKYFLQENDVMGDMFETAWKQTHNISAQGGSERIKYRLSLGYTDEDGVMVTNKDAFTRTNVTSYVSGDITSWLTTSLDMSYNHGNKSYPFVDGSSEIASLWKTGLPSYHPMGTLPYGTDGEEYLVMTPSNVTRQASKKTTVTDNTRLLSRTILKPFDGFEAVLEYSYQAGFQDIESYANSFTVHQGLTESLKPSTAKNPFTQEKSTTKYTTINAFATYNKSFLDTHNLSLLAGYNQEKSDYRYQYSQAYNMISDGLPSLSGSDGSTPPTTKDSYTQYSLRSGFFRGSYNYKQRYFLEVNGRYDLSSKFPKDYRGGFFPSVSAGWSLANEKFMEKATSFLSTLKLRTSYGTLGNQNISAYSYFPTMDVTNAPWLFNDNLPKTLGTPGMVRANFTWEKVESINGGLDFGFLNNRLTGSFDIYRRNTLGMLGPAEELPAVAGATAPLQNAADLKSKGWELSLSWRDRVGKVDYGVSFNLYDSRSYITRYKNETGLFYDRNEAQSAKRYRVGMEIGEIWGYVTDGFYTANDFNEDGSLKEGVVRISGVNSHVGDIKYKNLRDDENSKNVIDTGDNTVENPGDRKIIGNSKARLQYGVNGFANWKGLGFSFILQGVGKRDAWIGGDITFPMPGQFSTVYKHQVGKIWTENNPNAFYGRIYENAGSSQGANQRISDKFLYNAAYLRVKNVTLSYTVPDKYLQSIFIKNLKAFVSTENLFTFDHLPTGIDPENLGWNYPYSRTISFGINFNL